MKLVAYFYLSEVNIKTITPLLSLIVILLVTELNAQSIPPDLSRLLKSYPKGLYHGEDQNQVVYLKFDADTVTMIYQHAGHRSDGFYQEFVGSAFFLNDSVINVRIKEQRMITVGLDMHLIEGKEPDMEIKNQGLADDNPFARKILDGAEVWLIKPSGAGEKLQELKVKELEITQGKIDLNRFVSGDANKRRELSLNFDHALSGFPIRLELQPTWSYRMTEQFFDDPNYNRSITLKKDGSMRLSDRPNIEIKKF